MFMLITAAAKAGPAAERNRVVLVCDEAQKLVSRNMNTIFEQARSYGTPLVLAHQYYGQLKESHDVDMTQNVDANCVTAIDLGTPDLFSMQRIEELSPPVRYAKLSWQQLAAAVSDPRDGREFVIDRAAAKDGAGAPRHRERSEGTPLQREDDRGHLEVRTERLVPRPGPSRLHPTAVRDAVRLGASHPRGDVRRVRRAELARGGRQRPSKSSSTHSDSIDQPCPPTRGRSHRRSNRRRTASKAVRDRIEKHMRGNR